MTIPGLHVWSPQGPYSGIVWYRGMKKGQIGPTKAKLEDARRWCLRRMMRERKLNRAVVTRHDYDDFLVVWKATQA